MKILKARNGIALTAVLAILLITSLFIPVMFSMGETALSIAVKGTDRQRVSYFARTVTEMSVAAFKAFESNEHVRCKYAIYDANGVCENCGLKRYDPSNPHQKDSAASDTMIAAYNSMIGQPIPSTNKNTEPQLATGSNKVSVITTDTIIMAKRTHPTEKQQLYYVRYLDEAGNPLGDWNEVSEFRHRELGIALEEFLAANKESGATPPFELKPDPTDPNDTPDPTDVTDKEDIHYFSCSKNAEGEVILPTEMTNPSDGGGAYEEIGRGYCEITYDNTTVYYKTDAKKSSGTYKKTTTITAEDYAAGIAALADGTETQYSYSKKENKNVIFKSYVTLNGYTSSRTCILVLPTYPSEEEWLEFGVAALEDDGVTEKKELIATGGNQVFVNPDKATSRVPISYTDPALVGIDNGDGTKKKGYVEQNLLVYSGIGNMVIRPTSYKNAATGETVLSGENNSKFVLGVQPGLNTTPNNDPTYETIDAVNYDGSEGVSQKNNFVAFSATNAIQVDMPINLLVNPCRANRAGDNKLFGTNANGSLFKVMMFQAPIIQFNDTVDMMVSFYVRQRNAEDRMARRMSSVVLMAPENTPYSYYHDTHKKIVKAGMVYFAEDCYLWIIEPGDDGSSSSGWGFLAETVYKRDKDFTKMKIANAGDVYYFNSEIEKDGEQVGFSLTAYIIETKYLVEKANARSIWDKIAGMAITSGNYEETYDINDWQFVGNTNDESLAVEPPKVDGYYTYWVD